MKTVTFRIAAATALLGLSVASGYAQTARPAADNRARPSKQYTIEQFLNTVSIAGASFSADESRILFSSNKTGIWNVYSVAATGGEWTQITNSTTESTYAVSYFPIDDRILLTRDQGGNELNHLYVRTPDGQERDLTPGEKLKAAVRRLDAGRHRRSTCRPTSAIRSSSTSIATTRRPTNADAVLQERRRLLPRRHLRRRANGCRSSS